MVLHKRARQAEDKLERRASILDATEILLREDPRRLAQMSEVAAQAGLAKGTMYLYANKWEVIPEAYTETLFGQRTPLDRQSERGAGLLDARAPVFVIKRWVLAFFATVALPGIRGFQARDQGTE